MWKKEAISDYQSFVKNRLILRRFDRPFNLFDKGQLATVIAASIPLVSMTVLLLALIYRIQTVNSVAARVYPYQ